MASVAAKEEESEAAKQELDALEHVLDDISDLSDLDDSLFMTSNGQSGNPLSGLHKTFLEPWSKGEYFRFSSTRRDAEINRTGKLTLQPE